MNRISPIKNQYLGINAHLHSWLQGEKIGNRFHSVHISDLMKVMQPAAGLVGLHC